METMEDFIENINNIGKVTYDNIVNDAKKTSEEIKKIAEKYDTYESFLKDKEAVKKVKELINEHLEYEQEELRDNNDAFDLLLEIEDDEEFME